MGSTHVKAALVASEGGVLHVARRATDIHAVRGGGAFHRPGELLGAAASAIAECAAAARGGSGGATRPVAIGIASMAESGVLIDRRDTPIGDILAWHDPRPERQAAWLERQIGAPALFARTGLRPEPKYTLPKLLWLREQKAADFTRLRRWAGVAELVALDLTGQLGTNASLACRTMAFDVLGGSLGRRSARALPASTPDEMPAVLPLGRPVGGLTASAAARLGLPTGTPVTIVGHDHLAAAIGAGVDRPGDVLDSMGSAEATLMVTAAPVLVDELRRAGFSTGCHAIDGVWYVAGGLQSSGALVEWFVDTFLAGSAGPRAGRGDPAAGAPPGRRAPAAAEDGRYAAFVELLERAGPGPVEPIVRPYLRGRTAPHRDATAGLEFEGIRESHGMPDLAAAVIDGSAYHVRWMLDELARITEHAARPREAHRRRSAKPALGGGEGGAGARPAGGRANRGGRPLWERLSWRAWPAACTVRWRTRSPTLRRFDRVTAPAGIRARYDAEYLDRWLPAVITRLRRTGRA